MGRNGRKCCVRNCKSSDHYEKTSLDQENIKNLNGEVFPGVPERESVPLNVH